MGFLTVFKRNVTVFFFSSLFSCTVLPLLKNILWKLKVEFIWKSLFDSVSFRKFCHFTKAKNIMGCASVPYHHQSGGSRSRSQDRFDPVREEGDEEISREFWLIPSLHSSLQAFTYNNLITVLLVSSFITFVTWVVTRNQFVEGSK